MLPGEAPILEDWVTPGEAADMVGLTKMGFLKKYVHGGRFTTMRQLSTGQLLLPSAEVRALVAELAR